MSRSCATPTSLIHDAQYLAGGYHSQDGLGPQHRRVRGRGRARGRRAPRSRSPTTIRPATTRRSTASSRGCALERRERDRSFEILAAAEGDVIELAADPRKRALAAADPTEDTATVPILASGLVDRTVLLGIADSATAATMLEAVRADGLRVVLENDGTRVLDRALEVAPSLVIVDETLPGLDGPGVARAIRADSRFSHDDPLIILVTDHEPVAAEARADGITDWLVKPFSKPYARARIRAWLLRTACRWVPAPIPADEERRLAALRHLGVLDTPPEERFDRLTRLAAAIFDVPTALVSLVDQDRQWFKSALGVGTIRESPRESSFCAHAVVNRETLVVPDTLSDMRFADNPMVTGGPRVRFYAGEPLILPDGSCVGTVCLIDTRPREIAEARLQLLRDIGALVQRELLLTDATFAVSRCPPKSTGDCGNPTIRRWPPGAAGDRTSPSAPGAPCARTTAPTATPGTTSRTTMARSKAYRWGEDGLAGICDRYQLLVFALALLERARSDPEGAPVRRSCPTRATTART